MEQKRVSSLMGTLSARESRSEPRRHVRKLRTLGSLAEPSTELVDADRNVNFAVGVDADDDH